ncbi:MAG: DHA2 family efflux MFS transporter permease subunit [Acetobacteraceae bacterium]|nr:DHA2 family efflux MFS transporter permease subunit [Acetobacteraceae bacterium]
MEVLDTTIANVALRHIAGSLAAGEDESTYIITSYLVSNAIVLPISGWLSNVIGRKRFYMGCVALFTASSVMCGLSTSLGEILLFRVLQGIGGGGLAPTEQSIFADSFTPKQRALAFSLYGFTVVTAPAVGPVLGGWLTDNFSWHWVFLINLPVGMISLTLVWLFVYDSPLLQKERRERIARGIKVDYFGFVLVALGFGCLQVVLDRFERDDGFSSTFISTLSGISFAAIVGLVVWELIHPQPVVNLRLLRSRAFAISNVVMFLFGFIIVSTTQLLPQFSQELLGYDATTAGMTLGMGGLVSLVVMPISGLITGRLIQPKWLVLSALLGVAGAMHYATGLDLSAAFWNISAARMLQVMWLPLLFIPLSAVQFVGVPPGKNPDASAIINLMRNLGGSVGVSVVTTELQWRSQFHHARLAEHVTPYDGWGFGSALSEIGHAVQTQASILSYLDVFTILTFAALAATPLVLFLPNLPKGAAAGAH